jgi:GNAT superfamily N-acetyltransferase
MLEVFFHAVEDLDTRRGQKPQPRNAAPLEMHFAHLLASDPRSCYVAEDRGRVVSFGVVMRRGEVAFLSFLFVEPAWQARGLGRAVFEACIKGTGTGVVRLATCAEANQPVSTGLYAKLGIAPRAPIYLLRGRITELDLPSLPVDLRPGPVSAAAVADLDRALLGYERAGDHAFWARERVGAMFLDRDGRVRGYGYAHPSGRVGPVAAADAELLPTLIGYLVRHTPVLEGRQLVVPGPAIGALRPLLSAGMRIDGTPAVYCSQGPPPALERYLPMSFALL